MVFRKQTFFSFFFLLIFFSNVSAQNEKKLLKNAEKNFLYKEYGVALDNTKQLLSTQSGNAKVNFVHGASLFEMYHKVEALKYLKKAYKINPHIHPELPWYYARALHFNHLFDEAAKMYQVAIAKLELGSPQYKEANLLKKQCSYAKQMIKDSSNAKIINLGNIINSEYAEYVPVISTDESIMFFTAMHPDNYGNEEGDAILYEDIYVTEKVNGHWKKPHNPGPPLNGKGHDAVVAISPDGQRLFIYKHKNGGDIYEADLNGDQWGELKKLNKNINTKYNEPSVSISADGKTLYFVSDKPGGLGEKDIYVSHKNSEGEWGVGKSLGSIVNTPYDEDAPFIHPNGKDLYFSSKGHKGLGGYDIFKVEVRKDGSYSKPVNLGYPINTADDDIYFVLSADGKTGYYSSAREGGIGEKDIYKIQMPQPKKPDTIKKETKVDTPIVASNPLTILKGRVFDGVALASLKAHIKLVDNEKDALIAEFYSNSKTGKYLVSLPSGKNYGISIECEGYLFHSENFNIPITKDYQEVQKDFPLHKIQVGSHVVLKNVFFDFNKATLRKESQPELNRIYSFMQKFPKIRVRIAGYTDNIGSDEYNETLSQKRAESVVQYLIDKGIEANRLEAKGYGETDPIDTNETEQGRQNNRRTEVIILKN